MYCTDFGDGSTLTWLSTAQRNHQQHHKLYTHVYNHTMHTNDTHRLAQYSRTYLGQWTICWKQRDECYVMLKTWGVVVVGGGRRRVRVYSTLPCVRLYWIVKIYAYIFSHTINIKRQRDVLLFFYLRLCPLNISFASVYLTSTTILNCYCAGSYVHVLERPWHWQLC